MEKTDGQKISYRYKFSFPEGAEKEFEVVLEADTFNIVRPEGITGPEWTRLDFFKCPNCPLNPSEHDFCPVAANLVEIAEYFKVRASYEETDITVDTPSRRYFKHTTLQRGVSSLIGIYMVTSGCPVMEKLKPMVRYHLPFATEGETKYRAISMYLVAQYLLYKRGLKPDWDLRGLARLYEEVRVLNRSFCKRLSHIKVEDANLNAVVILDCFADAVKFSINEDVLDEMERLFEMYFRD